MGRRHCLCNLTRPAQQRLSAHRLELVVSHLSIVDRLAGWQAGCAKVY